MAREVTRGLAGQHVRISDDPGRRGETTGRTKQLGQTVLVEVAFGPNDKDYKPDDTLELIPEQEDADALFAAGTFGGPEDLRRLLTYQKIRGDLTNVFYSMESSNTDFYPHQFKPVLAFVESITGRLLIADEVGLGKTIEAMFVWRELQAREDARRLLVVCPAMLREKWRSDLQTRFDIDAEIVKAAHLREELERVTKGETKRAFVLITSLEGIRPRSTFRDTSETDDRSVIARLLEENNATAGPPLIDLAVVDEAHYMRNPETANQRFGRLLREAASHLLLLTATPIQIGSENLFNLLRLVDPDFFDNAENFERVLSANRPVVDALRALWATPTNTPAALRNLEHALSEPAFQGDPVLTQVKERLEGGRDLQSEERVELARLVETRSLLSHYMTRTRKRDVLENRVTRAPQVESVHYTSAEQEIYETVTHRIREMSEEAGQLGVFRLIARQRQMASCMVAALESWQEKGLLEEYLEEYLWEDLGLEQDEWLDDDHSDGEIEIEDPIADVVERLGAQDLRRLEANDQKYAKLKEIVTSLHSRGEKAVVFAFYRGTLQYLSRRLHADGFTSTLILGGMGRRKEAEIEEFRRPDGPAVLLSSEVGSEGIDLQFCRTVINYDLPWNPMRVEQRIGRIDRLGQTAEKITVVSFFNEDTIEDRILRRLYDRLEIFRRSIGDIEEILGGISEELVETLLDPKLTEEEREKRAEQTQSAILYSREEQNRLEQEAINLVGFTDYLLDQINDGRSHHRWVGEEDLRTFVTDYLSRKYPGCTIRSQQSGGTFELKLSDPARRDLGRFIQRERPPVPTTMPRAREPVTVTFDPKARPDGVRAGEELVSLQHPLVRWIGYEYSNDADAFQPTVAVRITNPDPTRIRPGDYVFACERWEIRGLRSRNILAYQTARLGESEDLLDGGTSERLVTGASADGKELPNAAMNMGDPAAAHALVEMCSDRLTRRFERMYDEFVAENEAKCRQEEEAARRLASRRITAFEEQLREYEAAGRTRLIPMTRGKIEKEQRILAERVESIEERRRVHPAVSEVAKGFIRVLGR